MANASADKIVEVLDSIVAQEKIDLAQTGNVFVAKDTRVSSEVSRTESPEYRIIEWELTRSYDGSIAPGGARA